MSRDTFGCAQAPLLAVLSHAFGKHDLFEKFSIDSTVFTAFATYAAAKLHAGGCAAVLTMQTMQEPRE